MTNTERKFGKWNCKMLAWTLFMLLCYPIGGFFSSLKDADASSCVIQNSLRNSSTQLHFIISRSQSCIDVQQDHIPKIKIYHLITTFFCLCSFETWNNLSILESRSFCVIELILLIILLTNFRRLIC